MANILVTGANGQVGSEIRELAPEYKGDTFFFTDRETLDITNKESVESYVETNGIDVIINCAAYTAVDQAESDLEVASDVNHIAVEILAATAKQKSVKLIHISTDYVFDGTAHRPYVESDSVNPKSVYGTTKCDGEKGMCLINPANSVIIRTSWVYSAYGNNFVKTMLRLGKERDTLGVIFDQVGTPTYAKDLARALLDIVPKLCNENVEIYHYSNEGVASWYDFAQEIMALADIECHINPIETKEYPTPAARPAYSLLNKGKFKATFDMEIPYWKTSLKACLQRLNQ